MLPACGNVCVLSLRFRLNGGIILRWNKESDTLQVIGYSNRLFVKILSPVSISLFQKRVIAYTICYLIWNKEHLLKELPA